jgi:hypothetical protein
MGTDCETLKGADPDVIREPPWSLRSWYESLTMSGKTRHADPSDTETEEAK